MVGEGSTVMTSDITQSFISKIRSTTDENPNGINFFYLEDPYFQNNKWYLPTLIILNYGVNFI